MFNTVGPTSALTNPTIKKKIFNMNKNFLSIAVGVFFSLGAIFLAFRNIPLLDLSGYFKEINYCWVLPSIIIVILGLFCRTQRWRLILGDEYKLSFWQAFHPLVIGFMINCVLPGRVGEIARAVILKKRDNFPFSAVVMTVAVERFFDMVFLLFFFAVTLSVVDFDQGCSVTFGHHVLNIDALVLIRNGMIMISLLLLLILILFSLPWSQKIIKQSLILFPRFCFFLHEKKRAAFQENFTKQVNAMIDNISFVFCQMREWRFFAGSMLLSAATWLLYGVSYYTMALGVPGIALPFGEIFAMMIIICFFIALPSVPGFWGLWEAGGVFALSIFGVYGKEAAAYTLINHAVQIIPIIVVGFISALITGVNIFSLRS